MALSLVCLAGAVLAACSSPPMTQSLPWWASVRKPDAVQADAFQHVSGASYFSCVRVGHNGDVRSVSFRAGDFGIDEQQFAAIYRQSGQRTEVKIYWIPLNVGHMPKLTVGATLLPGRNISRTVEQRQVAAAAGEVFYPSGIPIPVPGTWELTASAGSNSGCFIVTFPAPVP